MKSDPVLVLEAVSKVYRQGRQIVRALDAVDLTISQGEFAAIAGPSASGKTTLLNLAAGLDEPDSGKVLLGDRDLTAMSRRAKARLRLHQVGFVFQSYNLVPVLSAQENAEFILLLQGVSPKERQARVRQILKEVGLEGVEHRRPSELSGGQQQRVAVARAIAADPILVLADEPTANLDSQTALALLDLMERLNRQHGTTFLFSTHDPRVMKRARRLIELVDGRIHRDRQLGMGGPGDRG